MNFLFSHRNFPARFRHIITELAKNPQNRIVFLTNTRNSVEIKGVEKIYYDLKDRFQKIAIDT